MSRKKYINIKGIIGSFILYFFLTLTPASPLYAENAKPEQKPVEQTQEEDKVTGEVDLSVLSAYIWRGYEQTRNSIVMQPAVTASYKGFSVNVWGNLDTKPYSVTNANYGAKYTETDYTVSYSKKFGILQVTPGYIYYALGAPYAGGTAPLDAQELFLTLGLDTILSPTLTVYKEIDHYHQWYFLLGASHTVEFNKIISLKLSASVSYLLSTDETTYAKYDSNALPTKDKYNNFHDGTISISLPVAVYKTLSVTPIISYVFPLCNDARYEMEGRGLQGAASPSDRNSSFLYGGVTFSFSF
ncbi:MAG: hypothetical protein ABSC54_05190 [Smithellaceae bacterium]|jgi:hypothetical protein